MDLKFDKNFHVTLDFVSLTILNSFAKNVFLKTICRSDNPLYCT